jgi:hypothetical protein
MRSPMWCGPGAAGDTTGQVGLGGLCQRHLRQDGGEPARQNASGGLGLCEPERVHPPAANLTVAGYTGYSRSYMRYFVILQ